MLIPFDKLFKKYRVHAPGVLHLGANTGQEAEAYAAHSMNQVIWVEAMEDLHYMLVKHVARYPGHVCLRACVSSKDGEKVKFHVANNCGQSSSFLDFGTHSKEHPSVRFVRDVEMTTIRVDTLLRENHLTVGPGWFLNIDLQGAELLALQGMGDLVRQFDYAYIEVNERELYKGCPMVEEIDDFLATFGLVPREVLMTGSGWGDKFYSRP